MVPFRASVPTWLAGCSTPCPVIEKGSSPASGVWYLLYVVLHPGAIDWWPHEHLLSTSHEQMEVPTQISGRRASSPGGFTEDLKLLKVNYAFSGSSGPLKVQHRNSTPGSRRWDFSIQQSSC